MMVMRCWAPSTSCRHHPAKAGRRVDQALTADVCRRIVRHKLQGWVVDTAWRPDYGRVGSIACNAVQDDVTGVDGRTAHVPQLNALVLVGFAAAECEEVQAALADYGWQIACLTPVGLDCTIQQVLSECDPVQEGVLQEGRFVLCSGDCIQHIQQLQDMLYHPEFPDPIFGVITEKNSHCVLRDVVASVRSAHARMHHLRQPLTLVEAERKVPAGARLVMNMALDRGSVPCADGSGVRDDMSHVVVLDGMVEDDERQQLLEWLTQEGWEHKGAPPQDKWCQQCVDMPGAVPTWGLTEDMLSRLQHSPPPPVLALQSRLAALYPDYVICFMPAGALQDDEGEEEEGLSPFVGNAVMHQQVCRWHLDADPSQLPPHSPWVQHFQWYFNRQRGRPLFVSMMIYLNPVWPDEHDAETLFLDPDTSTGVFVRPAPGRVVLMDQDVPHRISVPAAIAEGPRYSLVWKLIFWPTTVGQHMSIARSEWGPVARFGSALGLGRALDTPSQA